MWNLKYDTNEPLSETETESRTWRTDWWLPMGRGLGEVKWAKGVKMYKLPAVK